MAQVARGWRAGPTPFVSKGELLGSDFDADNVDFRLPTLQGDTIRAVADFKYGSSNRRPADLTPIYRPNWGHISKISATLSDSEREWPFLK